MSQTAAHAEIMPHYYQPVARNILHNASSSAPKLVLLILLLANESLCQTYNYRSGLIFGSIGVGVLLIFIAFFFGIIICIYGRCTAQPYMFALIGTLLPLLIAFIIWEIPKESPNGTITVVTDPQEITSWVPVWRWIFVIFTYLSFLLAMAALFLLYCTSSRKTYRVGSAISSIVTIGGEGNKSEVEKPILRNREKYLDTPQIERINYNKARNVYLPGYGQTAEPGENQPRRRNQILEDDERNAEDAPLVPDLEKKYGKVKLPPMTRKVDMGIEIHQPDRRRKLNMVNPEQRTVMMDEIVLNPNNKNNRPRDSDDED
jgi:glucan phosphoethanolaminetransferase (alkaline phosphatase superfamily)